MSPYMHIILGHTNLISCSTDFWTPKIGASERFENFNKKIFSLQIFEAKLKK